MYCQHCGKKLPQQAKFCSSCGKTVGSSTKKPINLVTRFIFQLIMFLVIVIMMFYMNSTPGLTSEVRNNLMLAGKISLGVALFFIVFGIRRPLFGWIKRLFWYLFKRPKAAGVVAVAIIISIFAVKALVNNYQYRQALSFLDTMQEEMVPIFLTRVVGYDIQNNRGYPYGWSRDRIYKELGNSAEVIDTHQIPSHLNDYQGAVRTWGLDILSASSGDKKWAEVAGQPASFSLVLSDSQAVGFFEKSVEQLRYLKQFGDSAIKRGDRQTIRVIAAKLLLQQHFLENLSFAKTPFLVFVATVYAAGENRNPCIKEACLNNMLKIIPGVYRSALGFAAGEPKAAQEWRDNWKEAEQIFEQAGHSIGGTGITQGESDQTKNPPLVQAFFDACSAEGGAIGDTGGVKTRLPTSEDGYTCWLTKATGKCWKFMTFSGGIYLGGDAGIICPEENLLPPPPPPTETPKNNNNGGSGTRRVCPASAPVDCGDGCCPYGEGGRTDVCCPGGKCVTGGRCPSSGGGGGGSSSACPEQSQISGCGVIKPSCNCPADCPNHFIITNAPPGQEWIKGYKQCTP